MNTHHSHTAHDASCNAGWTTPKLWKLGDVISLTASGSAPGNETLRRGRVCETVNPDSVNAMC